MQIEERISTFAQDLFPSFYKEEGELFTLFVRAYYEWLEETGNTVNVARDLLELQDIDTTSATFLEYFKRVYLSGFPGSIKSNPNLTIKHIRDLYKTKGTPRAIELLFRIIFNDQAYVSYPSEDVLRPSNAEYFRPRYVEVTAPNIEKLNSLRGREVIGTQSQAKGFVESISTKLLNKVKVHVLYISNLRGDFTRGEIVVPTANGIQDEMPVIVGSLSNVQVLLGGQDNNIGDIFTIEAAAGKQGKARVSAVDNATGLVNYTLANGGFGFTTNTTFTDIDVNDNHMVISNVINAAQTYSNSSQIDLAQFINYETLEQPLETITFLSGLELNSEVQAHVANSENTSNPWVEGRDSSNNVIANGFIISTDIEGANGSYTISPRTGSFGNSQTLTITMASNSHQFQLNEPVDEESTVVIDIVNLNGSFSVSDTIVANTSGANGIVTAANSTQITVNGSFGTFSSNDSISVVGTPSTNAEVDDVSYTNTGANAVVTTIVSNTEIKIADIVGAFNNNNKIKGRRTNAIATLQSNPADSGVSDIYFQGNNLANAVVDTYANTTLLAKVIGFANTGSQFEIGTADTKNTNNQFSYFVQNTAAYIYGHESNTYANIVTVGTGSGSTFEIGLLENTEDITIYTDFVGENNSSNVSYLDCIIDGGNSGVGFLDTLTINAGGSGYANGEVITFAEGGAGGGAPTVNATANITTNTTGGIISTTVVNAGVGFYSNSDYYITTSGGAGANVTGNFDYGYGLPKDINGDYTTILDNVLTRFSGTVGTIATLQKINPGSNYNFDPFVSVYTKGIAKYNRRDIIVNIPDKSGTFIIGETVNQQVTDYGQILTVSVGTPANFTLNEAVSQVINGTANAIGTLLTSTSTQLTLNNLKIKEVAANGLVTVTTTNTQPFTTGTVTGIVSAQTATINAAAGTSSTQVAKGEVKNQTETTLGIRRLSFSTGFVEGGVITGATSGATGTVDSYYDDPLSLPIGDNANVVAKTLAANGIVTQLEIVDSGFGYQHGAELTLVSTDANNQFVVSGTANVNTTGIGEGYWKNQESFLNTKYLHDNDYYQSHSYVVESGISLDKYREVLIKLTHVAGTKLFGKVNRESIQTMVPSVSNSSIAAL